jgi:pimeloyl-ACP methyl ester carboxylesterase
MNHRKHKTNGYEKAFVLFYPDQFSPAERRKGIFQNARFFQAVMASPCPFPALPRKKIQKIAVPVLVVRGAYTQELDILVTDELLRTLPNAERR